MNYFWHNVFDYFKDRRFGAVFFGTLTILFATLILAGIFAGPVCDLYNFINPRKNWPWFLPGIGLLLLALIWRGVRQAQARRLNRYRTSPLSRDELHKARSKLRVNKTGPYSKR